MTTYVPSSGCDNPSEEGKETAKRMLIGSCLLCWGAVGLLVIAASVSKLLGLF